MAATWIIQGQFFPDHLNLLETRQSCKIDLRTLKYLLEKKLIWSHKRKQKAREDKRKE